MSDTESVPEGTTKTEGDDTSAADSTSDASAKASGSKKSGTAREPFTPVVPRTGFGRLINGMTAIDFVGRRRIGFIISAVLIVATFVSLGTQGLNLGIDFEGGVSWEVPAANGFNQDEARTVLDDNGLDSNAARIQTRTVVTVDGDTPDDEYVKVQVSDQPVETGDELRPIFAEAAGVAVDDVNVSLVSASWGAQITSKAIRALIIFLIVVAIFISIRFEWRMAISAIAAMAHDVIISVGIYSIFQFTVTPATVIAFLTILGYSLYDTIVVFDRVRENEVRFETKRVSYDDIVNVSMNQVLMRSLTTSFSSIVPVTALLIIGAGIMGVSALSDFAVALLIGMVTGAYSSIFIASPLLAVLKSKDSHWVSKASLPRATGDTLRAMVISGAVPSRRKGKDDADNASKKSRGKKASTSADSGRDGHSASSGDTSGSDTAANESQDGSTPAAARVEDVLHHKPRPRRKTRR